jgi:hypothetical protein
MGNATTAKSRTDQAAEMAKGVKVTDNVTEFSRYVAIVAGRECKHGAKNGHITADNAVRCGVDMAEAELATLPATVDMEAKLVAVAVTVVAKPRFKCSKGCTFGHKTQQQAEACSNGSQAATAKQVRASIPVTVGGSLAAVRAAAAANEPKPDTTDETPKQNETPKPAPRARKLRSSSSGNTGRA